MKRLPVWLLAAAAIFLFPGLCQAGEKEIDYSGWINRPSQGIRMCLKVENGIASGTYCNDKSTLDITVRGTVDAGGHLVLTAYDRIGGVMGFFDGRYLPEVIRGSWSTPDGVAVPFYAEADYPEIGEPVSPLSRYTGRWYAERGYARVQNDYGDYQDTGTMLFLQATEDGGQTIRLVSISPPPAGRTAVIQAVWTMEDEDTATFTFVNDRWGNKGTGIIRFGREKVIVDISIGAGVNAPWGIPDGRQVFVKTPSAYVKPPVGEPRLTKGDLRLGTVELGMSEAQVLGLLGQPTGVTKEEQDQGWDYEGIFLGLANRDGRGYRVVYISVLHSGAFATARGVSIGDPADKVLALYGEPNDQGPFFLKYVLAGAQVRLSFYLDAEGQVQGFALGEE